MTDEPTDFSDLTLRLEKFATTLPDKDRHLFHGLIRGAAETIMNGFQAYEAEFAAAFTTGRTSLRVSYDDKLEDGPGVGKYIDAYIKPRPPYVKPAPTPPPTPPTPPPPHS